MSDAYQDLKDEIDLNAGLAASPCSLSDADRIDWLERMMFGSGYKTEIQMTRCEMIAQVRGAEVRTMVGSGPWQKSFNGPDLRSAIDAAINSENAKAEAPPRQETTNENGK